MAFKKVEDRSPEVEDFRFELGDLVAERYVIQKPLRRGGMGEVYLVHDRRENNRAKALKTLPANVLDTKQRETFANEFDLLRQVAHPGVVVGHEYGRHLDGSDFFVMEYVEWPTLEMVGSQLNYKQIVKVLYDLSLVLSTVHLHRIIHLDLKPNNIFIDIESLREDESIPQLVVKVGDFGLARDYVQEDESELRGSFVYTAPELFAKKALDERADIFSLGMIGFVLFTGRSPYDSTSGLPLLMQKRRFLPRSHQWPETLPKPLTILLTRCLQPARNFRPHSAGEVAGEFARLVSQPVSPERWLTSAPFIGRAAEIRQIGSILHEMDKGQHWAYLVSGKAGVGKSRLIDEFALRQQLRGFKCIRLEGRSIDPLLQTLLTEDKVAEDQLPGEGDAHKVEWRDILAFLPALVKRESLIICWHRFDELTDAELRSFKEAFLSHPKLPILWLLEAAKEPVNLAGISFGDRLVRRSLDEFNESAIEEFVGQVLDHAVGYQVLSRRLASSVSRKPGWLMLALQRLARNGQLRFEDGYWQITDPSLKEWRKEFGGLWEFDRGGFSNVAVATAEWLAVLDRPCQLKDLAEAMELNPQSLSSVIGELNERGILDAEGGTLRFTQPIIQEQIYRSIGPAQRGQLHRWVGSWLEQKLPHSASMADFTSVARNYYHAGAQAEFRSVMHEALKVYDGRGKGAIESHFLETALEGSADLWPDDLRIKGFMLLAALLLDEGRHVEAADIYRWLLKDRALGRLADFPRIQLRLGKCLSKSGALGEAITCLQEAYSYYKERDPNQAGDALGNLGFACHRNGEIERCLDCANQYYSLIESNPAIERRHAHLLLCARLYSVNKQYDRARECYQQITRHDEKYRENSTTILAHQYLVFLSIQQGDFTGALKRLDNLERQLPPSVTGNLTWLLNYGRALALFSDGQAQQGIEVIDRAKVKFQTQIDPADNCRILLDVLRVEYYLGSYAKGMRHLRQAMLIARRAHYDEIIPTLFVWALRLQWQAGKPVQKLTRRTYEFWQTCKHLIGKSSAGILLAKHLLIIEEFAKAKEVLNNSSDAFNRSEFEIPEEFVSLMTLVAQNRKNRPVLELSEFPVWDMKLNAIEDPFLQGMGYFWLLHLAIRSKEPGLEEQYFKQALAIFRRLGANFLTAQCLELYGTRLSKRREPQRARALLDQADEIFLALGLPARKKLTESTETTEQSMSEVAPERTLPLQSLANVIEMLNTMDNPEKLTNKLLEIAIEGVGAKRGLIFFKREKTSGLADRASIKLGPNEETIISRGIAELVFKNREPIFSDNASGDDFLGTLDSVRLGKLRSVACLPILTQNEVAGILYLDYGQLARSFSESERSYLSMVSHLIGLVLTHSEFIAHLKNDVRTLRESVNQQEGYGEIIGRSPAIREIYRQLRLIQSYDVPVLLLGETGVGKDLIARTIHRESPRAERQFIPLNCAAFPEQLIESLLFGHIRGAFTGANSDHAGFFEQADGGTIFLDEVSETSLAMQGKLLRVLQDGEFYRVGETRPRKTDVRLIAAGKPSLPGRAESGAFRQDLYYRLKVIQISIPSLRERPEDIRPLAERFLALYSNPAEKNIKGLSSRALSFFQNYPWPGNVRELENTIQQALIYAPADGYIGIEHLPSDMISISKADFAEPAELATRVAKVEKDAILAALNNCKWNREAARHLLGISKSSLSRKIREYAIDENGPAPTVYELSN